VGAFAACGSCFRHDPSFIISFVSSLSPRWYSHFKQQLYAFSYDEIVDVLLEVTQGRRKARTPFEVQIEADLTVRVRASPRLQLAREADEETKSEVRTLELHLDDRDDTIRRIVRAIAREQRAFICEEAPAPRRLEIDALAKAVSLPSSIVEAAIKNKTVVHPRGICRLEELVRPDQSPPAIPAFASQPGPLAPQTTAARTHH
jgi:DNA-directed RNA polymerase specialized sigma54-like protein